MITRSLLFAMVAGSLAAAEVPSDVARLRAELQEIRNEVAVLRQAVAGLQLERQREEVRRLQVELDTIRVERLRLTEADQSKQQELGEIEQVLAANGSTPADRAEAEQARNELAAAHAREIREQTGAINARESELRRRLQTAEQTVRYIEDAWRLTKGTQR